MTNTKILFAVCFAIALSGCKDDGSSVRVSINDGPNTEAVAKYCDTKIIDDRSGRWPGGRKITVHRLPKADAPKDMGEKYCQLFRRH